MRKRVFDLRGKIVEHCPDNGSTNPQSSGLGSPSKSRERLLKGFQRKSSNKGKPCLAIAIICFSSVLICLSRFGGGSNTMNLPSPRVVQLHDFSEVEPIFRLEGHIKKRKVEDISTGIVRKYHRPSLDNGDCKPMHSWQHEPRPSCNTIHEVNMENTRYIASGFFRSAYWMPDGFGSEAVIKILNYNRNFTLFDSLLHQDDAKAYEMTQASKYIPNIYGYCKCCLFSIASLFHKKSVLIACIIGYTSSIFDYAPDGDFRAMLKKNTVKEWTPEQKLRYAWQMTKGLADMHSVGNKYGSAAMAHTDIKANQYLWLNGRFQLNDMNRLEMIRYNTTSNEACPFYESVNKGDYRSPEEYTKNAPHTDRIDVYSLGNILWHILSGDRHLFGDKPLEEIYEEVPKGLHPTFSDEVVSKYTKEERSVKHAMDMCFELDPSNRASAMDIEAYLKKKMKKYKISRHDK